MAARRHAPVPRTWRMVALVACALCLSCVSVDAALWTLARNGSAWSARDCSASTFFQKAIWVFGGGTVTGPPNNDVWYTLDGKTWLRASAHAQWPARQAHSVVVYRSAPSPPSLAQRALVEDTLLRGTVIRASRAPVVAVTSHRPLAVLAAPAVPQPQEDMLLLMGGTGGVGEYLNDVWSSRDGFLWQQVQGSAAWPARAAFCALELQGQLFVMAGVDGATLYNDVWVSNDGGASWSVATQQAPWAARFNAGAVAHNGTMFIMGGQNTHPTALAATQELLNDVWMSVDGVTWTQLPTPAWSKRAMFGLTSAGSSMWLFGGGMPATNDIWRSTDAVEWTSVTTHAPWPPRAGLGSDLVSIKSVAEGPEVFAVLGGHDTPEHYYADVWVASAEVLCLNEGVSCSGHGVCTTTRGCDCAFGWAGPYCTAAVCHAADCVNGECSAVPSGGGQYCKCAAMWGGPRCDIPECSKGCSPVHGSCPNGPNTCTCEEGWVGPDCTLPAPPGSVISLGEWVTEHATLLFEAVGGGSLLILLSSTLYMNYWARRAAAGTKRQRRVHWASTVVTHDDRGDPRVPVRGARRSFTIRPRRAGRASPDAASASDSSGDGTANPRAEVNGRGGDAAPTEAASGNSDSSSA